MKKVLIILNKDYYHLLIRNKSSLTVDLEAPFSAFNKAKEGGAPLEIKTLPDPRNGRSRQILE